MHVILDLALTQSLIESVAQGQIVLVLGAGQELIQLEAARVLGLLLLGSSVLLGWWSWGRLLLLHLLIATTAEHSRHCVSNGVSLEGERVKRGNLVNGKLNSRSRAKKVNVIKL